LEFVVVGVWVLDNDIVDVSLRMPVLLMVVFGKLMTVNEADAVDEPLVELVPVVIAGVAVLRRSEIKQSQARYDWSLHGTRCRGIRRRCGGWDATNSKTQGPIAVSGRQ
jgi:hypothetical protein